MVSSTIPTPPKTPPPASILSTTVPGAVPARIKHKNKYSEFSKQSELDPIEETIQKVETAAAKTRIDNAVPTRGTTVPTLAASPKRASSRSSNSSGNASSNASSYATTNTSSSMSSSCNSANVAAQEHQNPVVMDKYEAIVPSDPFTFGYVQIGKCLGPHGVHGEIKVQMETDFADVRLQEGSLLYVKRPHRLTPRPVRVESGRRQVGNTYLVRLESIKSRLGALAFKGFLLYVKSEDRPALQTDEYLVRDLVGLECCVEAAAGSGRQVQTVVGTVVGVVLPEELCDTPSAAKLMHAMIEVKLAGTENLTLLPLVPQIVLRVDLRAGRILLDPPAGLLDLVYVEKEKTVPLRGFLPEQSVCLSRQDRRWLEKASMLLYPAM